MDILIDRRSLGAGAPLAAAALLLISGCNGDGSASDSASTTASGSDSASDGSTATTTAGESESDGTASGSTSVDTTTTDTSDSDTTATSTTTGATDSDTDVTTGDTTGVDCTPVSDDEVTCDGIDDDCNGIIDDVDVGGDGFCDCLKIALFGSPGSNPNSQFEAWLTDQGTTVKRIGQQGEAVTPDFIGDYDVIILDLLPRDYSAEEAGHFQDWVEAGGGLMAMTGHTANESIAVARPNSIVEPMGVRYIGGLYSQAVTDFTDHPLTKGLTSVTFLGGFRVEDVMGDNTIIATLPPGPVAIAQQRVDGRIYLWGDEWVQFDSEWQNLPEIKVFWQNALAWLTPDNFCTIPL
ncbi:MAG: hypothetical protein KC486_24070 [Myxococcales bacterium]|nr:hypothetical protein [Myxococcales bacterium]